MDRKPGRIEAMILRYFEMASKGCAGFVSSCDYTPYRCGYAGPSRNPVNSYELCLFVTGKIRCRGEIEKHFIDKRSKSSYRSVLRAVKRLEKKELIERENSGPGKNEAGDEWLATYRLVGTGG